MRKTGVIKIFIQLLTCALLVCSSITCKTVPVANRKELNLVPDFMIKSMAFIQYDSVIRVSRTLPAANQQTQMIRRVGTRIQKPVEDYMSKNGFRKDLKGFERDYNLIDENIINAWYMPGGKVVVYTGLLPITQNETALAIEADKFGLIFAAMGGYDPEEAVPFWQRMSKAGVGNKTPEFLSTHPSDEARIKKNICTNTRSETEILYTTIIIS